MTEKILFVDDDDHILRAFRRHLPDLFAIETAGSGAAGLELINTHGPFAVVVADMRMPAMDGIQFLARVKAVAPDTVRIMLTGNVDLQTAIDAINEGNIFRFLTKPCSINTLVSVLRLGLEQYRLVTAERELLEKTLSGSIKVLTEILSLANPKAFSRASRARRVVRDIAAQLQLPNAWQFELAAMLSQIGCITFPPDLLDKIYAGAPLSPGEQEIFQAFPAVGRELLAHIPRLEPIARMIGGQHAPAKAPISPLDLTSDEDRVGLGTQLLKLILDFEKLIAQGLTDQTALSILRSRRDEYNPYLLDSLEQVCEVKGDEGIFEVMIMDLQIGMIVEQAVCTQEGILLVSKGQEVTYPVLVHLRNFAWRGLVKEPIRVRRAG